MTKPWPARLAAFLLWALAALSASFWFTQVTGTSHHATSAISLAPDVPAVQSADLARVFGPAGMASTIMPAAPNPAVDASARLRLLGVVANRAQAGVALISVDGQPPRPYRVGSALEGGWKLQKVGIRSATLLPVDSGAPAVTIELAPFPGALAASATKPPAPVLPQAAPVMPLVGTVTPTPVPAVTGDDDTTPRN